MKFKVGDLVCPTAESLWGEGWKPSILTVVRDIGTINRGRYEVRHHKLGITETPESDIEYAEEYIIDEILKKYS